MQHTDKQVYTAAEVAGMMGFSRQYVTTLFEREPGVILCGRTKSTDKRRYRSLRIPRHVYERVLSRMSVR